MTTPGHASEADGRDRSHATFLPPDLGSFCRLDELGLQVVGQQLEPGRAVLARPKRQTASENFQDRDLGVEATGEQLLAEPGINRPTSWLLGG